MTPPQRLRMSRARGSRLPDEARSVAYPTIWANPFRPPVRTAEANERAVEQYRAWLTTQPELVQRAQAELPGRDLACWCPLDLPCHADVLLAIANHHTLGNVR
ncbi:DUF4326 domain-containing protein [Naumannella cuiyingiana]|uniref:DUF4326 domain-containing protein n=1 Tax=Naumannella cuiyingiana TaxID=1347891 RepID=UPI0015C8F10A